MLINKLLAKNQQSKAAIKKAEAQLKSKQETGDDLQCALCHVLQQVGIMAEGGPTLPIVMNFFVLHVWLVWVTSALGL